MTNQAVAALKKRQAAELEALVGAATAAEVVSRAQQRRTDELQRLDAAVDEAERGEDLALAVLATLMSPDVAAGLADVAPARMRQAQQRAPVDEVHSRVQALTDGAPVPRRRGRPRGSGRVTDRGAGLDPAERDETEGGAEAPVGLPPVVLGDNP